MTDKEKKYLSESRKKLTRDSGLFYSQENNSPRRIGGGCDTLDLPPKTKAGLSCVRKALPVWVPFGPL
jgi:hypothetical protein